MVYFRGDKNILIEIIENVKEEKLTKRNKELKKSQI
jgi:hypothetical protein